MDKINQLGLRAFSVLRVLSCLLLLSFGAVLSAADLSPDGLEALPPFFQNANSTIEDFSFRDLSGRKHRLSDFKEKRGLVLVMRDPVCGVSRKYGSRLGELSRTYSKKGFQFLFVNLSKTSRKLLEKDFRDNGFVGLYADDYKEKSFQKKLRVYSTTETFILDPTLKLLFRGPMDDQFSIARTQPEVSSHYLTDVLENIIQGLSIKPQNLLASGCVVAEPDVIDHVQSITYSDSISKIIETRCLNCHHLGGSSEMTFANYEEVKARGPMIKYVLEKNLMPPWYAADNTGPWLNDLRLLPSEKASLLSWIDEGYPLGKVSHKIVKPPAPKDPRAWTIHPDVVYQLPQPIPFPNEGPVQHESVWIKTNFNEDRWINGYEVHTSGSSAIHHILFWSSPIQARPDAVGMVDSPAFALLLVYAPGNQPWQSGSKPSAGIFLPAHSNILVNLHILPDGKAGVEQTEIGFTFSKEKPDLRLEVIQVMNSHFEIPAGVSDFEVKSKYKVPADSYLIGLSPHMHLRGKRTVVTTEEENKPSRELFRTANYRVEPVQTYLYQKPVFMSKGSLVTCQTTFDNSPGNPSNPDPTRVVTVGVDLSQEMAICYLVFATPLAQSPH